MRWLLAKIFSKTAYIEKRAAIEARIFTDEKFVEICRKLLYSLGKNSRGVFVIMWK
jgi:hypothetical protein